MNINNSNIIFIGFMATGKSTIGKLLASQLGKVFIDTDNLLETKYETSIDQIFKKYGEEKFREYEREIIHSLVDTKNHVISTGGGAVTYKDNFKTLKSMGTTISLIASIPTIAQRITNDSANRPLLEGTNLEDKISNLLQKRAYYYINSDIMINTDNMTIENVIDVILGEVNDTVN